MSPGARKSLQNAAHRFWPKVNVSPFGCWLWTAARNKDGYGSFGISSNETVLAHRASWELDHDMQVPASVNVLHSCDMPSCVNPDHLFLGSQGDNVADCVAKDRRARQVGEANGNARLSDAQRADLIYAYRAGGISQSALGRCYGISQARVSQIIRAV